MVSRPASHRGDGPDGDAPDDGAGEAGREVGGLDHHGGGRGTVVGGERRGLGQGEGQAVVGGQVAGHARHRQGVGPVGGDVEVEDGVGVDAEGVGQGHARRRALRLDDQDAGVVVGQAQLRRRAQHPLRPLPPHLPPGDLHTVGQPGADGGQGHEVAGAEVERPAHDLPGSPGAVAGVDLDQLHLVGVGMDVGGHHPGHDHPVQPLPHPLHTLHHQPQLRQRRGQAVDVVVEGREVPQPGEGDLHATPVPVRIRIIGSVVIPARSADSTTLRLHETRLHETTAAIRTARGNGCRWR